jgi:coiled-coil domain-containing protein 130
MSSLAATQADGYYLPVEYFESGAYKTKSKNQFNGSKGHNQYLTKNIVRFELPYDGFCQGCGAHVSKGTRFNAQKTKAGNYFSTTIWKFNMKCRACASQEFVIRTNPSGQSFEFVQGIHKHVQEFDTTEAGTAGVIETNLGNKSFPSSTEPHHITEFVTALDRLQTIATNRVKILSEHEQLKELLTVNASAYLFDSSNNATIRANFRVDRKHKNDRLMSASKLGWKVGMELLLGDTTEEILAAKSMTFRSGKQQESSKFLSLRRSSIFQGTVNAKKRKQRIEFGPAYHTANKDEPAPIKVTSIQSPETVEPKICRKARVITPHLRLIAVAVATSQSNPLSSLHALACYDSDSD